MRSESFLRQTEQGVTAAPKARATGREASAERVEPPVSLVPPEPVAQPDAGAVREDELTDRERELRHAMGNAAEPSEAALDLAGLLCSLERYDEALAAIEAACARSANPLLRVARAALLRDLGRRDQAAAELRMVVRDNGPAALHPGLLFEWAELEWLAGRPAEARAALVELAKAHPKDPWCVEHRKSLDDLSRALESGSAPALSVRDLLGELRGGTSVSRRIRAFELVMSGTADGDEEAQRARSRAVAAACADESAAVRARGVQSASPTSEASEAFFASALGDVDPIVRRLAAERAAAVMDDAACPLLIARMAREDDAAVFLQLHESLAGLVASGPPLPAAGLDEAETRLALAEQWRRRCVR